MSESHHLPTGEKDLLEKAVNARTAELQRNIEELKKSEERYHRMIGEVEDYAILLLDRDGIIRNWNKGAEKIKGYKESEIVGENFRIFYLPEDRAKKLPEQLIEEASTRGKAVHEGWRMRKDGSRFWGSIVITALHDDQNQIIGFSKVTRDLTDIKAATDQIKDYARALEFQNRELQQFTYAAAHDLKEPLRKVQFYSSAVMETAGEKLSEKEKSYLDNAIRSATRMNSLIDDLLRYAEASSVVDKFGPVDIAPILEEVRGFYQESLDNGQIFLDIASPTEIWGIPFQIRQLFDNLVGNAVKYRQAGSPLRIDISCNQKSRPFSDEQGRGYMKAYYEITVKDNGIGFDPEYAEQIFDLFHRLHSRAEYPGTGVGLAICKRIVQNHKGMIEANGSPGAGAAFAVYLPCR